MLCDHHGYSISFNKNASTIITDWCSMQNIMTVTPSSEGMNKVTNFLDSRIVFHQLLPSPSNQSKCLMVKVSTTISETYNILTYQVRHTNELILDSGCSYYMFNTNEQLTDNTMLNYQRRHVQVANGHTVPVLESGQLDFYV